MVIPGRVQNGVVVLEGGLCVAEGTPVTVVVPPLRAVEPVPALAEGEQRGAPAWDSFFATKLLVGSPSEDDEELELTGDDLLF